MAALTVSSREIARMLAGSDDPELIRPKMARLNAWHKSGFFASLECGAVNPGAGRGGVLEYPAEAKAYAALFNELADGGASAYETALLTSGFGVVDEGAVGRAMRGEQDVWLFWRMPEEGDPSQIAIHRKFATTPTLPEGWPGGRWLHLTRVFARARQ